MSVIPTVCSAEASGLAWGVFMGVNPCPRAAPAGGSTTRKRTNTRKTRTSFTTHLLRSFENPSQDGFYEERRREFFGCRGGEGAGDSGALGGEVLHEGDEGFDAGLRKGVVERGADAADGAVTLQAVELRRLRL